MVASSIWPDTDVRSGLYRTVVWRSPDAAPHRGARGAEGARGEHARTPAAVDRGAQGASCQRVLNRDGALVGLPPVGSFWPGQLARTFFMAAFSAEVTHSPYFFFTATCAAT